MTEALSGGRLVRSWSTSSGRCAAGGGPSCCCAAASSSSRGGLLALGAGFVGAAGIQVQSRVGHRIPHRDPRRSLRRSWRSGSSGRLRRRVTDLQVALYVEEHEPSLQAAILSAVDIGATTGAGGAARRAARSFSTGWSSRRSRSAGRFRAAATSAAWRSGGTTWCSARWPRSPRCCSSSARVLPPGRVGAARPVAQRRGGQPVRDQGRRQAT